MSHSPADASDRSLSETENKVTLRCGPAATRYTGTWRLGHKTELEKCVDNLSRFFRARLRRHHSNSAKCERRLGRYQLARIELITSLVFGLNLFEGLAASSNIPSSRYLLGPVHRRSSHRADARTRAGTTGSTCRVPGRAGRNGEACIQELYRWLESSFRRAAVNSRTAFAAAGRCSSNLGLKMAYRCQAPFEEGRGST